MIPRKMDLETRNIKSKTEDGETYYEIEGIKNHFPDLRFPPEKVKQVLINYSLKDGIRQEDIQELSEFDKNVIKIYKFKK